MSLRIIHIALLQRFELQILTVCAKGRNVHVGF